MPSEIIGPTAPSALVVGGVSTLDGLSGAVTLVAGTGITITDNVPIAGDITITAIPGAAAAGALTGATLAANVLASSLTSVGTLLNLTVTNPIAGSVTGASGSTTGNAATATALATPRAINGVNFDGTAPITVTAAAGTLTGTTLNATVVTSSLTSVGTLATLTVTAAIAGSVTGSSLYSTDIPQNSQTGAYVLVLADSGKHISITTGGVTVPSGIFSAGDVVSIVNNSASNQTITQGGGVTMYLAGTATTGNRTLAQRGICTALCIASNTFIISGAGLT